MNRWSPVFDAIFFLGCSFLFHLAILSLEVSNIGSVTSEQRVGVSLIQRQSNRFTTAEELAKTPKVKPPSGQSVPPSGGNMPSPGEESAGLVKAGRPAVDQMKTASRSANGALRPSDQQPLVEPTKRAEPQATGLKRTKVVSATPVPGGPKTEVEKKVADSPPSREVGVAASGIQEVISKPLKRANIEEELGAEGGLAEAAQVAGLVGKIAEVGGGNVKQQTDVAMADLSRATVANPGHIGLKKAQPRYDLNPPPPYPEVARRRGFEGKVVLEVAVKADGTVGSTSLKESSGYRSLDRSALSAVRRWQFFPATEAGAPVPSRVVVPIDFVLRGN